MSKTDKISYALLLAGLVLCLVQIWLPAWYLTGDGPCHVANAQILYDMWHGKNADLYARFYTVNSDPNPNWSTHILLAALMHAVNSIVAEKILLSVLVLLQGGGLFLLLKRLNKGAALWAIVALLFIFHQPLVKGFYNFSYSMAFFCLLVYSWLTYLERQANRSALLFLIFMALCYFTHPVAFGFGCISVFSLWVSYVISGSLPGRKAAAKALLLFLIGVAPFAVMFLGFSQREGGFADIHIMFKEARIQELLSLSYLANFTDKEIFFTSIAGYTVSALTILALVYRVRKGGGVNKYDGFILAILTGLILFLFLPDWMLGGGLFSMRAGLLICMLACCYAAISVPRWIADAGAIIIYVCFVGLCFVRFPVLFQCSDAVDDELSANKYIKPGSVILPLTFRLVGKNKQGEYISLKNGIFCHVAQYMAVGKPLIVLDNYEANTGYFPLKWRKEVNPYTELSREQSIEGVPPAADIAAYMQKGVNIDNILMFYYDSSALTDTNYRKLARQIDSLYHKVYTSPTGYTMLYERK